jgi:thioredoxin-dependent peroxiredoxin
MFRKLFILVPLSLAMPAQAVLSPPTIAPDFATQAAKAGKTFPLSLSRELKKGPVVLYFYPAAFTPGCTIEANQFAEAAPEFRKMGATVIGMSADKIDTLVRFSNTECRGKFAVAVATPKVVSDYDVTLSNSARSNRTTYVIARDGRVAYSFSAMDYREHVKNALAAVRALKAQKR